MRIVFSYLTQIEVTKMQQGNLFLYDKAVSRCQVSINTQPPVFFFRDGKRDKIYMLDVSAYKLHERSLSMEIWDFNLRVVSFKHGAFTTGGRKNPRRCLKFLYPDIRDSRTKIHCNEVAQMLMKHISHSVC